MDLFDLIPALFLWSMNTIWQEYHRVALFQVVRLELNVSGGSNEIFMDPRENNNNNADGITVLTRTSKYGKLSYKLEMADRRI